MSYTKLLIIFNFLFVLFKGETWVSWWVVLALFLVEIGVLVVIAGVQKEMRKREKKW